MPVEEVAVQYKTEKGSTFGTKREAELHDAVEKAEEAFRDARRALGIALAATHTNAEGEPFVLEFGRTYYYLQWWSAFGPKLIEVCFSYWDASFDVSDDDFRIVKRSGYGKDEKTEHFDPSSLFASYNKGREAQLASAEEYMQERMAELEKLRATIARGR